MSAAAPDGMDPASPADMSAPTPVHTPLEDAQALFAGTLFVSLALILFNQVGMITGGTAGVAFVLHYLSGFSFGKWFFLINLPFYALAWRAMGRSFTLKTFAAVTLLSALTGAIPRWAGFAVLDPWFAAVAGGLSMSEAERTELGLNTSASCAGLGTTKPQFSMRGSSRNRRTTRAIASAAIAS